MLLLEQSTDLQLLILRSYSLFRVTKQVLKNCEVNDINISKFRTKLSTYDWSNLYLTSDLQIGFTQF